MALFSTPKAAEGYSTLQVEDNAVLVGININSLPITYEAEIKLKDKLINIAGIDPTLLQDDKLARYAGFTDTTYNVANRDWHKLTYYMLFRLFFKVDFTKSELQARFNEWWTDINEIRLAVWNEPILNTPTIKRLCKNGEEEVYTSQEPPVSATSPNLIQNEYTKKSDYDKLNIIIHQKLFEEAFQAMDTTPNTDYSSVIPLHIYLLGQIETPYLTEWLEKLKSLPFWVYGSPTPTEGTFTKITLNLNKKEDRNDLIVNYDDVDFNRYPRITEIINSSTKQIRIRGYKIKKVYVSVYDTISNTIVPANIMAQRIFSIFDNSDGEMVVKNKTGETTNKKILHVENDLEQKYFPDYKAKENFATYSSNPRHTLYQEKTGNNYRNFVRVLEYTIDINDAVITSILPVGININDLIGYPIYVSGTETTTTLKSYYIKYPKHPTIPTAHTTTTSIINKSGLTLGLGIDLQNGISNNSNGQQVLNDFLSNACTEWNSFLQPQKDIIYSITGKVLNTQTSEQSVQAVTDSVPIWFENLPLFNQLDLNEGNKNYATMVAAILPFLNNKYLYGENPQAAIYSLKNKALQKMIAEPNIFELFALLALSWNGWGFATKALSLFSNAINQHNYTLFMNALDNVSDHSNNKGAVIDFFNRTVVKDYYRNIHFNEIS